MRLSLRGREQGDTIVEVLIAIAIVSMVLVAAYVITGRNTTALQTAQEREQGQHLVETQIEELRTFLANPPVGASQPNGNFCMTGAISFEELPSADCATSTVAGSGATYSEVIVSPGSRLPSGAPCSTPSSTAYTVCAYWTGLDATHTNDSDVTMYYEWSDS